jgi:hypothetical protein
MRGGMMGGMGGMMRGMGGMRGGMGEMGGGMRMGEPAKPAPTSGAGAAKSSADPLSQAETALKKLRTNPKDKKAADALERALKQLREGETPDHAHHH